MAMALGYKSLIKIRCVSHFHVSQSCIVIVLSIVIFRRLTSNFEDIFVEIEMARYVFITNNDVVDGSN